MTIAYDVMTGGKTMQGYDIYKKCIIMQRAFKVYWTKTGILVNDSKITYNNAFAPQNLIARLRPLGLTPIPGLGRRPIFNATPTLARVVAANVRAAVLLSQRIKQSIGTEYKVCDTIKALWKPRANIELDLLIDQALDQKKGIDINAKTFVMRPHKRSWRKSYKLRAIMATTTQHLSTAVASAHGNDLQPL